MSKEFDDVLSRIAPSIARVLEFIPEDIKTQCEEIRIRAGLPLCLTLEGKTAFIAADSSVSYIYTDNAFCVNRADAEKTLALLCDNSVYLHESEIRQGFISVTGGCRVGVCGSFNADGMLVSVNSLNIRIAHQIYGCASELLPYADKGLLIAGPPGCGKTTMLRDTVRQLSNGSSGKYYRVAVIDSRGEISGGEGVFDLGVGTDVFYTQNKASGTQIALRTMYPDIIAFDEIGTQDELLSVKDCFNAGVSIVTTVHCSSKADLANRKIIKNIIDSGAVFAVALLSKKLGEPPLIIDVKR